MIAKVGDRIVVGSDHARTAVILAVPHADGSPPYVVRWLATGHIAMVSPGEFSRIIPASHPAGTGKLPLSPAAGPRSVEAERLMGPGPAKSGPRSPASFARRG